jgi:hypothetical protein
MLDRCPKRQDPYCIRQRRQYQSCRSQEVKGKKQEHIDLALTTPAVERMIISKYQLFSHFTRHLPYSPAYPIRPNFFVQFFNPFGLYIHLFIVILRRWVLLDDLFDLSLIRGLVFLEQVERVGLRWRLWVRLVEK